MLDAAERWLERGLRLLAYAGGLVLVGLAALVIFEVFMRYFYGGLTEGQNPADALRQAMVSLRESYPHPYYWAPFVLTGRP